MRRYDQIRSAVASFGQLLFRCETALITLSVFTAQKSGRKGALDHVVRSLRKR